MRTRTLSRILPVSVIFGLLACQKTESSSEVKAQEDKKRLAAVQSFARELLEEQVASIKSLELLDEQERYIGGSEAKEIALLQSLVRNLGGLMTATYLADKGDGLDGLSFPDSKRRVLRDAHPKGLLCLKGSFEVEANTLFSNGFLGESARYPATVRFSSSAPSVQSDSVRDIRGFAVEVQTEDSRGHDFVNLSTPTFPTDTAGEFSDLVKVTRIAKCNQDPRGFAACAAETGVPNPINLAVAAARFLSSGSSEPQNNLVDKTFFGVTPYSYSSGADTLYFKYRFVPESCTPNENLKPSELKIEDAKNFLGTNVRDVIARQAVCYGLKIVPLTKEVSPRWLEQHTRSWEDQGATGTEVKVATLRFEQGAEELDLTSCDQQTFSPDHLSPGFKALGSLNRARALIYEKLAIYRQRLNVEIEKLGL